MTLLMVWLSGPDLSKNVAIFCQYMIRYVAALAYSVLLSFNGSIDPVLRTVTTVASRSNQSRVKSLYVIAFGSTMSKF
jgi:hypothetical protein